MSSFGSIELIRILGAPTVAVTVHGEGMQADEIEKTCAELQARLGIPVVAPLEQGVGSLVTTMRELVAKRGR